MKPVPSCILYCRDVELTERLQRISARVSTLHAVNTQDALDMRLSQAGDAVLVADLRAPNCLGVLSDLKTSHPNTVVIVMGASRSDPLLEAELLDPFATVSLDPDRLEFQHLLRHALEVLSLRLKALLLENELAVMNARQSAPQPDVKLPANASLQNFSRAQRNFDNIEKFFDSVVDGIVDAARVSRVGIFIRGEFADVYTYLSGTRCMAGTRQLKYSAFDPFVRWLEIHPHLISKQTLNNISEPEERAMLRQVLDAMGAEVILPLHVDDSIRGWMFVGPLATGMPFDLVDLDELTGMANHISTTYEKALAYKETALQKILAETLLHSIPFGIIACDQTATIRWFNSTAHEILQPSEQTVIGQRAELLGSHIADLLRRALDDHEERQTTREWNDPRTKQTLSAETRRLCNEDGCVGAMIMLRDITGAKLLQEKEEQLERAAFWTDLAASMSHEIRNPLVAIKTFAQLLPERYDDPDFRMEFCDQVTGEIDRLNLIVDKINSFADSPRPVLVPLDIRRPIERAVTRLKEELNHENLRIHLASDDSTLRINGDAESLEEGMYHLLLNAAENLKNKEGARINVCVKSRVPENGPACLFVIISDNGSGIDESVRNKLFSPFSTIKARGLGLGLPIAKRSVVDHNGQLDIQTGSGGTSITITLPATAPDQNFDRETEPQG